MVSHEDYVLGTDDAELVRLGVQHRLWAASASGIWERAGIAPGAHVLDVGAGPGFAAMDIAELVGPRGRVLGVEGSAHYAAAFEARAAALGLGHAGVVLGDVQDLGRAIGADAGSFDVAYARWVYCFLSDIGAATRGVFDALKPGGRFAVQDYFGYEAIRVAPRRAEFERGIAAVSSYWREHGDLDVMGHMPRVLREAGFEIADIRVDQHMARPSDPLWQWPTIFWPNFLPRVVEAGHLSEAEHAAFLRAWEEASGDPDSFILLPPVFEIVAAKPGS